jgi:NAD(P)-dependent dehydrogenase (short-subunit alcohol dehydrogenase family)
MADRLKDKVAVITGAASGIGRAAALLFAAEGARVLAADIDEERGDALAASHPGQIRFCRTDVAREDEVAAMIAEAVGAFGRLDCLFNNAGIVCEGGSIETLDLAQIDLALQIMVKGTLAGIKHAVPALKAEGGVILSTASIAGLQGGIAPYGYSAAKAAIIQITRVAALELAPFNIRVNCLCPGAIATPIFGKAMNMQPATAEKLVARLEESFKGAQPLPRAGLPEDVAEAALYLAAESGRFVSGHALVIDGGLMAGPFTEGNSVFGQAVGRAFDPKARK